MPTTMRTRAFALTVALLCAGKGPWARGAEPPPTVAAFAPTRVVDGRTFVLTGEGVHRTGGVAQYAMALYVDELDARRAFPALVARAGGRARAQLLAGDHAQS